MKRSLLVFVLALVATAMLSSVAMAAGGGVWTTGETPLYQLPDATLPAFDDNDKQLTLPADTPISVYAIRDGWVSLDNSAAYTDTVAGLWLQNTALTSVKPASIVAKEMEAKLKAMPVSGASMWDFFKYFQMYWAPVPAPVAASAAVAPAPVAASAAVAACVEKGDRWSGLGGKSLLIPAGCEVWISSDPATVTVNKVSATSSTRLTLFVAGPAEINIAIGNPANAHYHIAPAGGTDANNRDGAETNWVFQGGKFAPRPEKFR